MISVSFELLQKVLQNNGIIFFFNIHLEMFSYVGSEKVIDTREGLVAVVRLIKSTTKKLQLFGQLDSQLHYCK